MMTTHNNNACPHPVKHSASRYTEPLNKVKCTEGGGKSQKPLIYHQWHCCIKKGMRCCQYTWVQTSQRQQACTESMFSVPVSFGKGRREKIKRKLAYLGSSHQEIIHWPGKGDSLFTRGSSVSFTNSSHYLSHLSLVRLHVTCYTVTPVGIRTSVKKYCWICPKACRSVRNEAHWGQRLSH